MKTVLLLGAGASRAEGNDSKYKQEYGETEAYLPPLDKTFFEQAVEIKAQFLSGVADFVEHEFGLDIRKHDQISMEQIFNMVFAMAIDNRSGKREVILADKSLRSLLFEIIRETTKHVRGNNPDGICGLIRSLLQSVEPQDLSLITFNYDLLAEKALTYLMEEGHDKRTLLNLICCYGIDFDGHFSGKGPFHDIPPFPSGQSEQGVRIRKLHGSINWYASGDFRAADRPLPRPPEELRLCRDRTFHVDYFHQGVNAQGEKTDFYDKPAIVPPIYEKSQYHADILGPVWEEAFRALSEADRLVVFGYSLPPADVKAQCLLAGSLYKNQSLKRFDIIDKDAGVCKRFVDVTNVGSLIYHKSVADFVKQYSIHITREGSDMAAKATSGRHQTFTIPTGRVGKKDNRITPRDLEKVYLRITVDNKKYFPDHSCKVSVIIGGKTSSVGFTNRDGGDKRRSHLLNLGRDLIAELGIKPGGKIRVTVAGKYTYKLERL